MANLSPVALILIVIAAAVVALLIGYFLGSRFGGKKSVAMREAEEKHESYRNDVREHFEQTSAIMSRMVDDYRDMYQHMADGAEQLAGMHPEKQITPPPSPEAITRDSDPSTRDGVASGAGASARAQSGSGRNRSAVMNSDSSNDRPWNREGGDTPSGIE